MPIEPSIVTDTLPLEVIPIAELKPHFRNYQTHGPDEISHLQASLRQHGWYKNVVIAQDGTLLAGHGIVEAAQAEGFTHAPVRRLPYPPTHPEALKVLVGDNEQGRLTIRDEPLLTTLLREIYEYDAGALLGTGFDVGSLSDLAERAGVVPEAPDRVRGENNPDTEWQGMPAFHQDDQLAWKQLIVNFATPDDLAAFATVVAQTVTEHTRSIWYPYQPPENLQQYRYVEES